MDKRDVNAHAEKTQIRKKLTVIGSYIYIYL
jgi:hypothetical protein